MELRQVPIIHHAGKSIYVCNTNKRQAAGEGRRDGDKEKPPVSRFQARNFIKK